MKKRLLSFAAAAVLIFCCSCAGTDQGIPAEPIPHDENYSLITEDMKFYGNPDYPAGYRNSLPHLPVSQHPFMAPNSRSVMHNNAHMTGTYEVDGPVGLNYTNYPRDDGIDAWYFTAVDFETGDTIWRVLTGTGQGYNNNYASIMLGPQGGTAYMGVLNGL